MGSLGEVIDLEVVEGHRSCPIVECEVAVFGSLQGLVVVEAEEGLVIDEPPHFMVGADDGEVVAAVALSASAGAADAVFAVFIEAGEPVFFVLVGAVDEDIARLMGAAVAEDLDLDIAFIGEGDGVEFDAYHFRELEVEPEWWLVFIVHEGHAALFDFCPRM